MTGARLLQSIEQRLNLDFSNASDEDFSIFLGTVNSEKDSLVETINASVGERYFTVDEEVTLVIDDGEIPTGYMFIPTDAIGGIYFVRITGVDGTVRTAQEIPNPPSGGDDSIYESSGTFYYFEGNTIHLIGILKDDSTTASVVYDRYPANLTQADLYSQDDLSISVGLPRASHTALLKNTIYTMMVSNDSAYRAQLIGLAQQEAQAATENALSTLRRRNKSRVIIPRVEPTL